jgi:hypothetical protein
VIATTLLAVAVGARRLGSRHPAEERGLDMRTIALRTVVALALLAPLAGQAVDVADGMVSINGSGEWWWGRADRNRYLGADSDGTWSNVLFDLLVTARPRDDVSVSAQLGSHSGVTALSWMFGEWRASDALRLRMGKAKQPLGNYSELQFINTMRPFLALAQSVYGPADIATDSYTGAGATGSFQLGGTELAYDAYGGTQTLTGFDTFQVLRFPTPPYGDSNRPPRNKAEMYEDLLGARLSLTLPMDVVIRVSGFTGHVEKYDDANIKPRSVVYGASLWYRNDTVWLSAEAFRSWVRDWEDQYSGYVEVAAFVVPSKLQLAARYEIVRVSLPAGFDATSGTPVPVPGASLGSDPLLRHDELAVGVNWWFNSQAVVKASVHFVEGKRFTRYEDTEAGVYGSVPTNHTVLATVGMAFTY